MKISTLLMGGAALFLSANAFAADPVNLMEKANEGELGKVGEMAKAGWQMWDLPFTYDEIDVSVTCDEPVQLQWDDTTGPKGNNVRWENKGRAITKEGEAYDGKVGFFRWDNGSIHKAWYVFPVEITTPGIYDLSLNAGIWSNLNAQGDLYITTGGDAGDLMVLFANKIGPEAIDWSFTPGEACVLGLPGDMQGEIFNIANDTPSDSSDLKVCSTQVVAKTPGTYYFEMAGSHALFAISDFKLTLNTELPDSGVADIDAEAQPVAVQYFGMDGVEIANPVKGSVVIVRTTLSNGAIKVAKLIAE